MRDDGDIVPRKQRTESVPFWGLRNVVRFLQTEEMEACTHGGDAICENEIHRREEAET